jgi:phenylpropionate dioxygenase-like ring-hydroxylating dioxygenase large terminal subunit
LNDGSISWQDVLVPAARRFPFPVPFGWFSLGRVDELGDDDVLPVRAFGLDLVRWRDGDEHRLSSAWCPHLGAHLGHGGRSEDGCLVCPFHEWAFDAAGANVAIPYADRPNKKARLRAFPTMVRNGHLLAWYHPDASVGPQWDVPESLPAGAVECMRMTRRIGTVWQELAENSVDMAHFRSIHGLSRVSAIDELHVDGPLRRVRSGQSFNTARGEFEGRLESTSYGPGMGVVRFTLMSEVMLISTTTPIEDGEVEVRFTMYHGEGDETAARIGAGFGAEVVRQLEQDIPIWEHKRYEPSPALAPSEKGITAFRSWASQFYAEAVA